MVEGRQPREGRHRHLAAHPQRQGLGGAALAGGMGRHRLDAGPAATSSARRCSRRRRPQPLPFGVNMVGPVIDRLRHRGAEEALPAAHRQSRRLVVPGLLRARRRLRPRLAARPRARARRRPLRRQRPEDLDHAGAVCRLDLLPGAHRPGGEEAGGHLLPADRHEDAGHHGAADHHHRWRRTRSTRSSSTTCGAGREPGRRGEQGLGLRQVPARQRAHRHRARRRVEGAHPPR